MWPLFRTELRLMVLFSSSTYDYISTRRCPEQRSAWLCVVPDSIRPYCRLSTQEIAICMWECKQFRRENLVPFMYSYNIDIVKGTVQRNFPPPVFFLIQMRKKTEGQKSRWTVHLRYNRILQLWMNKWIKQYWDLKGQSNEILDPQFFT